MQTIEELDLSQSYMTSFPEELLPCLCSLKSVIFKENHYGDVDLFPAIVSLLQLETLESLVLSSNNIDAEFLNRLTPHILASKSLKEINLANNPFKIEECPDFIQACLSKGINIIYSLPKSQRIFITFINSLELQPLLKNTQLKHIKPSLLFCRQFSPTISHTGIFPRHLRQKFRKRYSPIFQN